MFNGYKKTCGANVYPTNDGKKLNMQIEDENPDNEPLLFTDSKVQQKIDQYISLANEDD
jgi:hypothetical protein